MACAHRRSIPGPLAGPALERPGTTSVHQCLDRCEDGALHERRDEHLPQVVLRLQGLRCVFLITGGGVLPHLLQHLAGDDARHHAADEPHWLVEDLRRLAGPLLSSCHRTSPSLGPCPCLPCRGPFPDSLLGSGEAAVPALRAPSPWPTPSRSWWCRVPAAGVSPRPRGWPRATAGPAANCAGI